VAQKSLTKTQRRDLHLAIGDVHPNVIARAARELKRSHRRLTRRSFRQTLRATAPSDF